ncbi:polyubiquitin 8-like [Macadamia integrifolia]|uniref:polyubiquitin 8-like n=1 Tax=Macadamia integrifolia TaxID=60698 RepID=UPI001C4E8AD1|nr:polyubiquitin 8-like [Macadamia integrifolia]XP_042514116.1 polyubiquitin 8-like [Macadamia integrifolia]
MKIFIKFVATGVFFGSEVNETDTIYMIKSGIEVKEGITPNHQMIIFNGIILEDQKTIASSGIENFSTVYVAYKIKEIASLPVGNETNNAESNQGGNEVQISVQDFVGNYSLKVNTTNTIQLLKAMVESKTQVSRIEQRMFIYSKDQVVQLEDGSTLDSYGIKENSQLWMLTPYLKILSVKMPQVGNTFRIDLYSFLTIHDIKKKIRDDMGIPENRQTLIWSGISLDDDETLEAYSLQHNSVLHVLLGYKDGRSQEISLFIHDMSNAVTSTFQLMVQRWYSILNIKTLIENMVEIPIGHQELYFRKENLVDWKTLAQYNIGNYSVLYLSLYSRPIQIFIKKPQEGGNLNENIMLEVKNTNTIDEIIAKIPKEYMIRRGIIGMRECLISRGILYDPFCLFWGVTRLKNELTLAHYGITSGTFLQLERSIQLHVGIPSGEVITVDLKPVEEIVEVKKKIEYFCRIPVQLQTLTHLGNEVDDFCTLEDYEYQLGSLWKLRWQFCGNYWSFFWPTYAV